jgi:hypothetical protein
MFVLVACSTLAIVACRDKEAAKETGEIPVVPSAPVLPPPPPPPAAPELPAPPTEEDFEEEASQQITSKNLEQELDKLERELKSP